MALLKLPAELVAHIFSHLDDHDVFTARRTNSILERASFSYFGKRFFRKKGYMITSDSLYVLQSISEHEDLRKHVQHVWFNPDCYTFATPACAAEYDEDSDADSSSSLAAKAGKQASRSAGTSFGGHEMLVAQFQAYQHVMRDHAQLLYTSKLEDCLASALALLPNLKTIGMRRSEDYGPYGWTILRDLVGEDPRVLGPIPSGPVYDLSGATHLFIALISALSRSHLHLQRFYTDAIEIDNIKEERLPQNTLDAALNSVLYVELNAVKGWLNTRSKLSSQYYNTLRRPEDFGAGLSRLLQATPQLKEIGLQIFPDRKQSHLLAPTARNPDSWRLSYPYVALQKVASTVVLRYLTRVKLEKVTTTSATLLALLMPSAASLTSIKVRDIRLLSRNQTSPTNPSIFSSDTEESDPRPWESFFTFLLDHCLNLEYLLLYHLMHDRGTIAFTEDAPPPMPAEEAEFLLNHVPPSHGGQGSFASYSHITMEAEGADEVRAQLERIRKRHWYHQPLFSYLMDETIWHTDTSDEEW